MTYTATISSQGQITVPAKMRRELALEKHIQLEVRGDELIVKREPTLEDIRAALGKPSVKPNKQSRREQYLSEIFTKKYLSK